MNSELRPADGAGNTTDVVGDVGDPLPPALQQQLDQQVARWHDSDGNIDMTLPQWLGLTDDEYRQLGAGDHMLPGRWRRWPTNPTWGWHVQPDSARAPALPWTRIIGRLWVGGYDFRFAGRNLPTEAGPMVELAAFDLIVAAERSATRDIPDSVETVIAPFVDGPAPNSELVDQLTDKAHNVWASGGRVLLRCAMGINRSAFLAAHLLHRAGWPASHAVHQLRSTRSGHVLSNPQFVAALRNLPDPAEDSSTDSS